jgi:glycosyltransferase involved in cell wall biosynthesis
MKICLINTYQHGGAANCCNRLAQALSEQPNSTIQVLDNSQVSHWKWKACFYAERLPFIAFQAAEKSLRFAFSSANWGLNLNTHPLVKQADVLHLHWINQGLMSLKSLECLANLGKPIVWTLHDMWAFTGGCHYAGTCTNFQNACGNCWHLRNPQARDLSAKVFEQKKQIFDAWRAAKIPVHIIASSKWLGDIARSSPLLENFDCTVLPNPINTEIFKPYDKQAARASFQLPQNTRLVLFMAMNVGDKRKGFDYLRKALELYKSQHPAQKLELVVVGKCPPEALQGLAYPVHNLGSLNTSDQIVRAYSAADLFAIPSLEDNLPNTVMESLACGTPVLGFRTGGIPEMVQHLNTGYIADYQQIEDFAKGLGWLLEHPDPTILGKNAIEFVHQNYKNPIVAAKYLQLYAQQLAKL